MLFSLGSGIAREVTTTLAPTIPVRMESPEKLTNIELHVLPPHEEWVRSLERFVLAHRSPLSVAFRFDGQDRVCGATSPCRTRTLRPKTR